MVNCCTFVGRVGGPPDLKYTPSGDAVVTFSVACTEKWKGKDGQQKEKTEWVKAVAWRQLAEIISKFVDKGMLIYISGKLATRSYEKDGVKHYISEVIVDQMKMLSSKSEGGERQDRPASRPADYGNSTAAAGSYEDAPFNADDEIPF